MLRLLCLLTLISFFFSCQNKSGDERRNPLISFYYSNFPDKPFRIDFSDIHSITVHHFDIGDFDTTYNIDKSESETLDSFISVFNRNKRDESYHTIDPGTEEAHFYTIVINNGHIKKTISAWGHSAPRRIYDFSDWVTSLLAKSKTKKQ